MDQARSLPGVIGGLDNGVDPPMDPRSTTREPGAASVLTHAGIGPARRRRTSVVEVRELKTLLGLVPAWEDLAAAAIEPNVFYEHWMLIPALEGFAGGKDVRVVLVLIHDDDAAGRRPRLGALFPLERIRTFKNLRVSALGLWQHVHCYACTPLVRAETAGECVAALLRWFQSGEAGASVLELGSIAGDGPLRRLLIDSCNELGLLSMATDAFTRGLWSKSDAVADPGSAVSGELRRQLRRKEKRLSERGCVKHVVLRTGDDLRPWVEDFLRIEASGWKGSGGTALAASPAGQRYFEQVAAAAHRRGRLLMLGIDFDGRPIARRCAFLAGEGSFAFKTAYDEKFAAFSPGTLLEVDNIRQLGALPGVRWMDSCAAPDNLLINRISNERRTVQSLAVGTGTLGELMVSGLPLLRWTHQRILKRKSTETKEASTCRLQIAH